MTRAEQQIGARLSEIRDVARTSDLDLTGKARRIYESGSTSLEHGPRFRSGFFELYPELRRLGDRPGVIADAIERGKGKVYDRVRRAVSGVFEDEKPKRKRSPEKPVIGPHDSLTKKCSQCGVPHGKGAHRFHGKGSWLQTHLFPYRSNMPKRFSIYAISPKTRDVVMFPSKAMTLQKAFGEAKAASIRGGQAWLYDGARNRSIAYFNQGRLALANRRKNPKWTAKTASEAVTFYAGLLGHGMKLTKDEEAHLASARQFLRGVRKIRNPRSGTTVVYGRLLRIEAKKTQKHRCDASCRKADHSYFHDFSAGAVVYGLPDGSLLIQNVNGKRLWRMF